MNASTDFTYLLPGPFQDLIKYYQIIDKFYCFVRTQNLATFTLKVLKSLMQKFESGNERIELDMNKLKVICALCPDHFKIVTVNGNEQTLENLELSFCQHPGHSKFHIKKRKELLVDAILLYTLNFKRDTKEIDGSVTLDMIKKSGWQVQISDCGLPILKEESFSTYYGHFASSNVEAIHRVPEKADADNSTESRTIQEFGGIERVLEELKGNKAIYKNQIKYVERFKGKEASYAELSEPLPKSLAVQFQKMIKAPSALFYKHQAMAIDGIRSGKHVVVCTATSSGKSVIFNIPVMETIVQEPQSVALYLFPTKALAQDQLRSINKFTEDGKALPILAATCDGDTPQSERNLLRQKGHIILTNPDMLHCTLLPNHRDWRRIFQNLRHVVIDEAHQYRGAFGSHVAAVFRRLVRICLHYRAFPQFVCCSATIANPAEHMCKLVPIDVLHRVAASHNNALSTADSGQLNEANKDAEPLARDFLVVVDGTQDGSPHGDKYFVIWNPLDVGPKEEEEKAKSSVETVAVSVSPAAAELKEIVAWEDFAPRYRRDLEISHPGVEVTMLATQEFLAGTADRPPTLGDSAPNASTVTFVGGWKRGQPRSSKVGVGQIDPRDALFPQENLYVPPQAAERSADAQQSKVDMGRSTIYQTAQLFTALVGMRIRTLAFCRVRKLVELVSGYSLHMLESSDKKHLMDYVSTYRAGYMKEERRKIEKELFNNKLIGVTTTCALELGIDIGTLDITLHMGFPGTFASLWQQAGRAGRSNQDSLAFMICFKSPVDQYFVRNPQALLHSPVEPALLDVSNAHIITNHILCAAKELPLNSRFRLPLTHDSRRKEGSVLDKLQRMEGRKVSDEGSMVTEAGILNENIDPIEFARHNIQRQVTASAAVDCSASAEEGSSDEGIMALDSLLWGDKYIETLTHLRQCKQIIPTVYNGSATTYKKAQLWSDLEHGLWRAHVGAESVHRDVDLRMIDPVTIVIVDTSRRKMTFNSATQQMEEESRGELIDSIGYSRAFFEVYEGAIYMHRSTQYLVETLDLVGHTAYARPVRYKYFTSPLNNTSITVMKVLEADGVMHCGVVQVKSVVWGYQKVSLNTFLPFEKSSCSLPPLEFETVAFWIDIPAVLIEYFRANLWSIDEAVHTLNHVIGSVAPLYAQCDVLDIQTEHLAEENTMDAPPARVMVYDMRPGGLGACNAIFDRRNQILRHALEVISGCSCKIGCPSCVFSTRCDDYNEGLNKGTAKKLLELLLEIFAVYSTTAERAAVGIKDDEARQMPPPADRCSECLSPKRVTQTSKHNDASYTSPSSAASRRKRDIKAQSPAVADTGAKKVIEESPRKKQRQQGLKAAKHRNSVRAKSMAIQIQWTDSVPDFVQS